MRSSHGSVVLCLITARLSMPAVGGLLTQGEFGDVLGTLGVVYAPTVRDATASPEFVEAMLRRKAWLMRDYLYVLYHKPGPIVSPSDFAR